MNKVKMILFGPTPCTGSRKRQQKKKGWQSIQKCSDYQEDQCILTNSTTIIIIISSTPQNSITHITRGIQLASEGG